jgi:pimeloyl-ACP methyl ester carboxylesterase
VRVVDFERLAVSATRVDVPTSTGAVVAAHLFGPAAKEPVVLVHGGAGSWNHWARTIPALRHRFRVIALDLPGCGDSTMPTALAPGAVVDVDDVDVLATAVADAVEQLVPAPRPFGLVAFSFGGIVAGRATAARLGPRVALLALIGAGGLGLRSAFEPPLRAVPRDASWPERAAAHRHNLAALMLADVRRADALAVVLHEANVARSRFRLGDVPSSPALVEVLDAIRAPLLWVTGSHDAFAAGLHDRRREVVRAACPHAEQVDVPDAGHWAAYERPDVVNPMLARRLADALPPPRARAVDARPPTAPLEPRRGRSS